MSQLMKIPPAALLVTALSACAASQPAPAPGGKPIVLSRETQSFLARYLRDVGSTRPGAFAVSMDGNYAYYFYCQEIRCVESNYSIPAMTHCRGMSGQQCVILYVGNRQRVAFVPAGTGSG